MEISKRTRDVGFGRSSWEMDGIADPLAEYPDSFYEGFINEFKPSQEKCFFYRFLKRLFDIVTSALLLILLFPLMLLLGVAVKLDSRGPAIFVQNRVGKDGKIFRFYKFRSMRTDAPRDCATSRLENPEQYQTGIGRVLRRLSLDELPQLWCVLIGTMSFVGYRPLVLTEENCNNMRARLGVFSVRPGISGYAQIRGRDDVYYKNKAIMDACYVKYASLGLDLKILIRTILVVLRRDGNHDNKKIKKQQFEEENYT